jgi:hypothetical protein
MVSSNEAGFDLREMCPLLRNILHNQSHDLVYTGQRTYPEVAHYPKGNQDWSSTHTSQKVLTGNLIYPVSVRDTAKSGIGHLDNRHLNYLVESIFVNVGGSYQNVKESSPLMSGVSVGGSIVVGGWESQPHGEGSQEFDVPLYLIIASLGNPRRTRCNLKATNGNGMTT